MAEKNKIGLDDVLEGLSDVLGIVGSAAARRVTTPVKAAVEVAKTLPKAQKANEAIAQAKALEKKLDAILDKPKITKADAKKANDLADKINDKLGEAADLGASTKKNSTISKVDNAVSAKISDINKEAGVKAKPATKVPGPDEARAAAAKAETKTPAPATTKAKTPEPAVTKPATKATKVEQEAPVTTKPTTKIEEGAELPGTKAKAPETPPKKETTEEKLARLKKEREEKAAAQKAERDKISAARKAEVDAARAARAAGAGSAGAAGTGEGENGDGGTGDNTVDPNDIPGGNGDGQGDGNGDGKGDGNNGGDGNGGNGGNGGGGGNGGTGGGGGGGGGGNGDGEGDGNGDGEPDNPPAEEPVVDTFDLRWQILKAKLLAAGLPETTVNNSRSYFETILKDARFAGQPNELDAVVDQYLYLPTYQAKDGRTVDSPFYQDFGKFNEKLTARKKPGELVGLVLGYKRVVDKYVTSASAREIFKSDDSITKYMQNDVSVAELDERANAARLRSVTADPFYVQSLKELGYIDDASDLTSFFLDPNVGTKALEDRRTAGAFATEAVRRASEATGIKLDTEFARQQAARLTNLGYSEAQITQLAGQGFENIAEQLRPTEKLSGIYERNLTGGAADAQKIQQELQSEQFLGTASQRRKKLAEQETQAFRGQSGLSTTALRSGTMGIL